MIAHENFRVLQAHLRDEFKKCLIAHLPNLHFNGLCCMCLRQFGHVEQHERTVLHAAHELSSWRSAFVKEWARSSGGLFPDAAVAALTSSQCLALSLFSQRYSMPEKIMAYKVAEAAKELDDSLIAGAGVDLGGALEEEDSALGKPGWVYVVSSAASPEIKIGSTCRALSERLLEVRTFNLHLRLEYVAFCVDARAAEKVAHESLASCRVPHTNMFTGRECRLSEWFRGVTGEKARATVTEACISIHAKALSAQYTSTSAVAHSIVTHSKRGTYLAQPMVATQAHAIAKADKLREGTFVILGTA